MAGYLTMLAISFGKDFSKFEFKWQSHESCSQDQNLRQYKIDTGSPLSSPVPKDVSLGSDV
jgi:hypothetical protein